MKIRLSVLLTGLLLFIHPFLILVKAENQVENRQTIEGKIQDIVITKGTKYATLGGKKPIRLLLTKKTKITDSKGNALTIEKIHKEQFQVKIVCSMKMTRSIPPITEAYQITTVPPTDTPTVVKTQGVIVEKDDNAKQITVLGSPKVSSRVILNIDSNTVIVDANNQTVEPSQLQENHWIEAEYGPTMTLSIPPITTAKKIKIVKKVLKVEGTVVYTAEHLKTQLVYVNGASDDYIANDTILLFTPKTQIVTQNGDNVTFKDLKLDSKVIGYYSNETRDESIRPFMTEALVVVPVS